MAFSIAWPSPAMLSPSPVSDRGGYGTTGSRGAEIGEINRIGLRLADHHGDAAAWFREWAREAPVVEKRGLERIAEGHGTRGASASGPLVLRQGPPMQAFLDALPMAKEKMIAV